MFTILLSFIFLQRLNQMHQCMIISSEKPYNSLQFKTVCFSAEKLGKSKQPMHHTNRRISSSRTSQASLKNFEVAMKLNTNYSNSKQIEAQNKATPRPLTRSLTFTRRNLIISPKKQYKIDIKLMKSNESTNNKLNIFAQSKFGNYKSFPKRQPKLKNSSPYKLYMFAYKSHEKYEQCQSVDKTEKYIKIKDCCTFLRNNQPPIHSKRHIKQVKYKNEKGSSFEPWNFFPTDQRDDQLIF